MTMDVDGSQRERDDANSTVPVGSPPDRDPFRCKLYKLGEDSHWEDMGTGFVRVEFHRDTGRLQVTKEVREVRDEVDNMVILETPVEQEGSYQLQGPQGKETIILWEDNAGRDFALSLESEVDTKDMWSVLSGVEKRDVGCIGPPVKRRVEKVSTLPQPSVKTVSEIAALLSRHMTQPMRDSIAEECMSDAWLEQLAQIFSDAEEEGDAECLGHLFNIAKGMFLLSKNALTERLLKKDSYDAFIGMLEHDEGIAESSRFSHRKILSVENRYRAVISFEDDAILERIHLNYRLMYLKDHILPRMIDDMVFMNMLQHIYQNTSQILSHIEQNNALLDQLFTQVRDGDLQALDFVQDCCRQMRSPGFGQQERETMYSAMVQRDIFGVLIPYIKKPKRLPCPGRTVPHANTRAIALDIVHMHAYHNPSHLQQVATKNPTFLPTLMSLLTTEADPALQSLVAEIIRWMMDFSCSHNPMATQSTLGSDGREEFLSALYDRDGPFARLALSFKQDHFVDMPDDSADFAKQMICEVVAAGLATNEYHSKLFVITTDFPVQALKLMHSPQKFLHLAVIRLIRAIAKRNDDSCTRYLISKDIFKPLIATLEGSLDAFVECGAPRTSGNMVVSAILDCLREVRDSDQKELLAHLCDSYVVFQSQSPLLAKFVLKYQQNKELAKYPPDKFQGGPPMLGSRRRPSLKEEEARREAEYFEGDDDTPEENDHPPAALLVAYDADETSPTSSPTSDRKRIKRSEC